MKNLLKLISVIIIITISGCFVPGYESYHASWNNAHCVGHHTNCR